MKVKLTRPIIILAIFIVLLLSLTAATSRRLQSATVSLLSPFWKRVGYQSDNSQLNALIVENQLLKNKLEQIQTLFAWEHEIQMKAVDTIRSTGLTLESIDDLDHNRQESYQLFELQVHSYPAHVIYRSPTTWNSTLWINIGQRDNRKLGRTVVSQHSPVVVGDALVGVVELVNEKKSRVRLLTDPEVTPSVRAFREIDDETVYLAKGELHGSANVIWRRRGTTLIGEGFNYDYDDEYGPSRDLRSEPPILKVGDLLVTTGMDGVFPKGFKVATVSKIQTLREGDYYYEIEALPVVDDLEEIRAVTVLPSLK